MLISLPTTLQEQVEEWSSLLHITPYDFIIKSIKMLCLQYNQEVFSFHRWRDAEYPVSEVEEEYVLSLDTDTEDTIFQMIKELGDIVDYHANKHQHSDIHTFIRLSVEVVLGYFNELHNDDGLHDDDIDQDEGSFTYGWDTKDLPLKYKVLVLLISNIDEVSWYKTFLNYHYDK